MGKLVGTAKRVSESHVKSEVVDIPYTNTWHPLHHREVIGSLEWAVDSMGLKVTSKEYSLSQGGLDMFAVWGLDQGNEARPWNIGFRNSMKKSFAVGVCAGNRVVVCDNLCFSGDFSEFKRHTSNLDEDVMDTVAAKAVFAIIQECRGFEKWFADLNQYALGVDVFKQLTFDAMTNGVFAPGKFKKFNEAYGEELEVNHSTGTLLDFHGAVTRVLKDESLFGVRNKTQILNTTCKRFINPPKEDA